MPLTYTADTAEIVNDYRPNLQTYPAATVLADGGWVVTYSSYGIYSNTSAIAQQRFDASGVPVGPETVVSDFAFFNGSPKIDALPDGGWITTWQGETVPGWWDIFQQRFSSTGEAIGPNVNVTNTANATEGYPDLAVLTDGGWVIAWHAPDGSGDGVFYQRFDSEGLAIGGIGQANTVDPDNQFLTQVASLAGGGWVIAWSQFDGTAYKTSAQVYGADGLPVGGPLQIRSAGGNGPVLRGLAPTSDGGFVVLTDQSVVVNGAFNVWTERFSADGTSSGLVHIAGSSSAYAYARDITSLADGGYAVGYFSLDNGRVGLRLQTFGALGDPTSEVQFVSSDQDWMSLVSGNDGAILALYVAYANNDSNIAQRHFQPDIYGTAKSETLRGTAFAETIVGYAGNDKLIGGGGDDVLIGGTGDDTYTVDSSGDQVRELTNQGTDKVLASITYSLAGTAVENLTLTGSQAIDGTGNGLANVLTGNAADNVLSGLAGDDSLSGSLGSDQLFGGLGDDMLAGGRGNDLLDGGGGFDTVRYSGASVGVTISLALAGAQANGIEGSDTLVGIENLVGSAFADTLTGNAGNNTIEGGGGNDTLNGAQGTDTASYAGASAGVTVSLALAGAQDTQGAGTDTLTGFENLAGSAFGDTLTGNGNANTLIGGLGDDALDGGGGSDFASYVDAAGGVTVSLALAGAQNTGAAGKDTLVNIENLRGSAFSDALTGNGLANILIGRSGDDTLVGGGGDDTLVGGTGRDTLSGGIGADRFQFGQGETGKTVGSADVVIDFSHSDGDILDLSGIDADSTLSGDQAFTFIGSSGFSLTPGQLRVSNDGINTFVAGDMNGDNFADFVIRLDGLVAVAASDFVL